MTKLVRTYEDGVWSTEEEEGGGSQPSAIRFLDLGTVDSVDLLSGPQTLYEPAEGSFFALTIGPQDFVAPDYYTVAGNDGAQGLGFGPVVNYAYMAIAADGATPNTIFGSAGFFDQFNAQFAEHNLRGVVGPDYGKVVAALHLFWSDLSLLTPTQAWQAIHAFASGVAIVAGGKLFTSGGGNSGGSEPDWSTAASAGDTISDDSITWTFEGSSTASNLPTQGTLHFYALVADEAEAP